MKAWILQANPAVWDVWRWHDDGAVAEPLTRWTIAVNKKHVSVGDGFALWVSGEEAGVYAMGTVTEAAGEPELLEGKYWLQAPTKPSSSIGISVSRTFFAAPLYRDVLKADPAFASALILRMPGGANAMRLSPAEWEALSAHATRPDADPLSKPGEPVITTRVLGAAPAPSEALLPGGSLVKSFDEHQLLLDYQADLGRTLNIVSITLPDGSKIVCDAFDRVSGRLIEAKASSTRSDVRMAIGQLMDYRRHVPGVQRCAVLVPERPSDELLDLVATAGFNVIHGQGKTFTTT